jgi:hypothetical protein
VVSESVFGLMRCITRERKWPSPGWAESTRT